MSAEASREERFFIRSRRAGQMHVNASFVCKVSYYLFVVPEYIWLLPGNNFTDDSDIFSNTEWYITND